LTKYPEACTKIDSDGKFYVSDGTSRICNDYFIPSQKTIAGAWYWTAEVMRIDQNIQRTNPNRLSMEISEAKYMRISKRNCR